MKEIHLVYDSGLKDIDKVKSMNAAYALCERLMKLEGIRNGPRTPGAQFEVPADIYDKAFACSRDPEALLYVVSRVQEALKLRGTGVSVSFVFDDFGTEGMRCVLRLLYSPENRKQE